MMMPCTALSTSTSDGRLVTFPTKSTVSYGGLQLQYHNHNYSNKPLRTTPSAGGDLTFGSSACRQLIVFCVQSSESCQSEVMPRPPHPQVTFTVRHRRPENFFSPPRLTSLRVVTCKQAGAVNLQLSKLAALNDSVKHFATVI